MKSKNSLFRLISAALFMLLLIMKSDIAIMGAQEGLKLCMQVIIPSLFPFFFLSAYMIPMLTEVSFPGFQWLCKKLGIPRGCEGLLILGLVGGYPVGAQAIGCAYQAGTLQKEQAHRLMGFCNNAGPAFIFGVAGTLFPSKSMPWLLWLIHIFSALLTGMILPKTYTKNNEQISFRNITVMQAFRQSLNVTASVCGWIILFKVLLTMLFSFIHLHNDMLSAVISGIFELSGGCIALNRVTNLSLRFILCSALLSCGGICVFMQTASVAAELGTGMYLPGKLMQTFLSILLSLTIVLISNENTASPIATINIYLTCTVCIIFLRWLCRKKLWKLCDS